jgi:hypothetical protein
MALGSRILKVWKRYEDGGTLTIFDGPRVYLVDKIANETF